VPDHDALPTVAAFAAIYLIWGSTFLAIRYAVETIPPYMMMSGRSLGGGLILLIWLYLLGLTLLLGGIASISLVVGGIGIMNIMLVSVRERTREIGIRKAVGARGRDILAQFLVEALTLSLLGGLIGIVLGLVVSAGIGQLAGWGFVFNPVTIVAAVMFSLAVGVVFGVWPARQAARLDPISALRYE